MKINYYLLAIIKENLIYLTSLFVIILLFIFLGFITYNKFNQLTEKNITISTEINNLKEKKELIDYQKEIKKEGIDIKEINKILSTLIPEKEDFFSVINALNEISSKTNFIITNYSINPDKTGLTKLSLVVEGRGDEESFFNFLQNYQYIGGRLITIDLINYQSKGYINVKFTVYFYSGKLNIVSSSSQKLTNKEKNLLKIIKEKTAKFFSSNEERKDLSYPTKANPF